MGTVVSIFVADTAGGPMRALKSAQLGAGVGIIGDRYANNCGHWSEKPNSACQLTIIEERVLNELFDQNNVSLLAGEHRRNLVVRDQQLTDLEGKRFQIGKAIVEYEKPRPPCGYLDELLGASLTQLLGDNAGICVRVLESGEVALNDSIAVFKI